MNILDRINKAETMISKYLEVKAKHNEGDLGEIIEELNKDGFEYEDCDAIESLIYDFAVYLKKYEI